MRSGLLLIASCAALALSAPAFAADYDPPIYIEEAPEFVPVEIGSGWYLRGDVTYDAPSRPYDFSVAGSEVDNHRFGGGVGFGYHFSDNFRADLTIAYLGGDKLEAAGGATSISNSAWSGLISGYFDIATVMNITPYVGAGVGLTYSSQKVTLGGTDVLPRDRGYDFAYALMAGVSYKVADNVSIDAGYQFLHTPDMPTYNHASSTVKEGDKKHLVRVGLRYDLW